MTTSKSRTTVPLCYYLPSVKLTFWESSVVKRRGKWEWGLCKDAYKIVLLGTKKLNTALHRAIISQNWQNWPLESYVRTNLYIPKRWKNNTHSDHISQRNKNFKNRFSKCFKYLWKIMLFSVYENFKSSH